MSLVEDNTACVSASEGAASPLYIISLVCDVSNKIRTLSARSANKTVSILEHLPLSMRWLMRHHRRIYSWNCGSWDSSSDVEVSWKTVYSNNRLENDAVEH